jgi:hypothetical protein
VIQINGGIRIGMFQTIAVRQLTTFLPAVRSFIVCGLAAYHFSERANVKHDNAADDIDDRPRHSFFHFQYCPVLATNVDFVNK